MKTYMLTIYQPDGGTPPPAVLERIMTDIAAINRDLKAAGSWVFAARLHPPSTATVVRAKGDGVLFTDGPFIEGKEHVGGFTLITAADLDAALAWARRLAEATTLPIEVRPVTGDLVA